MDVSKKNRTVTIIAIAALILVISFPGFALTVKVAGPESGWRANLLFHGRPASTRGRDPLSPSQIIGAYNLNSTTGGAGTTIAIVDAYDDPTIANDLATFSSYFGLPTATFVKQRWQPPSV